MRVLVLGGSGMLGHKLWQVFASSFDTYVTLHRDFNSYKQYKLFDKSRSIDHISAEDFDSVARAIVEVKPDVVVNCIGIVKQAEAAKDPLASIEINALFPHRLAKLCRADKVRLIHISTDCVFSGSKGNYKESGFIVPPEDPEPIAAAIRRAVSDDALVDRAAELNAKVARERLDQDVIRPQVIAMYEKIAAQGAVKRGQVK